MGLMSDICDLEEALNKTGGDLFKELFRIYPVADPEDYFKNGQWKNDVMKADLRLIESHRRECGSPDVADLDDIKCPPLPQQTAAFSAGGPVVWPQQQMWANRLPVVGGLVVKPAGLVPSGSVAGTVPGGVVAGTASVVEIRLIALFVAKWKLDPVTSKQILAKLTPTRRRYVIQNFKATKTGVEASSELEEYVAQCELDASWDAAAAGVSTSTAGVTDSSYINPVGAVSAAKVLPGAVGTAVLSGLKRPLTPTVGAADVANKKLIGAGGAAVVYPPAKGCGKVQTGW